MPAKRVTWLVEATPSSMGMRHYELSIQGAIAKAAGHEWHCSRRTVGTLRSDEPADVRVPHKLVQSCSDGLMVRIGRRVNEPGLTHRFDLRLPPSPHEVVTIHDLPSLHFDDEGRIPRWSLASAARSR